MEEEKPLALRVYSVPCYDYLDNSGKHHKVSAIIAPIRLTRTNHAWEIAWACSRALTCKNQTCRYSKTGTREPQTLT
jgi:hypothetical protein